MKNKHLWFLIPTFFALTMCELIENRCDISLVVLSMALMMYTFIIALIKNNI